MPDFFMGPLRRPDVQEVPSWELLVDSTNMRIIHALHYAVEATKRGDHVGALQIKFFAIEQARKVESLLWEHPGSRCRFD